MNARLRRLLEDLRAYVVPSAQSEGFASHSGRLLTRLDVALKVEASPKKSAAKQERRRAKTSKREAAALKRTAIRDFVFARAEGRCEVRGDHWHCHKPATELDHFFGRARAESVETCWAICATDHRNKTNNSPSAEGWLETFAVHCDRYGYREEAARARNRLAFVLARSSGAETAGSAR